MEKLVLASVLMSAVILAPASVSAQTYTYDSHGRVSSVVQPNGAKAVYYYDNLDNRTASQTATNGTTTITPPGSGATVIPVTSVANLRTLADNAGYSGLTTGNYQFVVPAGVTIMGAEGGGHGITTGTWPGGITLSLVVYGNVYGGGGSGGEGGEGAGGYGGTAGGDAVYATVPITVTINSGASIKGGGGGGGGGASNTYNYSTQLGGVGCGGGGGFPNGEGGLGGVNQAMNWGMPGAAGTTSGGGAGGGPSGISCRAGGNGGNAGAAGTAGANSGYGSGGAGGAAGYAVRKNGNTVTVTNNGNVAGTIG